MMTMHAWSESNLMKFMCHLAFFWAVAMKNVEVDVFLLREIQRWTNDKWFLYVFIPLMGPRPDDIAA